MSLEPGLAGLTAAFYLVRDGQMKGEHVHVLEKLPIPGGSTDGIHDPNKGFIMRGGREMDNHFEVMWDVFRDVPSRDNPEVSVLDDYYWLNKKDPNYSLCRATLNRGEDAHTGQEFTLDSAAQKELTKLYLTPEIRSRGYADRSDLRRSFLELEFLALLADDVRL
jgi:oleate hydratase